MFIYIYLVSSMCV